MTKIKGNNIILLQDAQEPPTLTRVLHYCAEDTINDEQIQRVLVPVIRMIEAGVFEVKRNYDWLIMTGYAVAILLALMISTALA